MAFPLFRALDGELITLRWTRLKPIREVLAVVPPRPEPRWHDGLAFGDDRKEEIGAGFDRRTVFVKPVVADDGLRQVGDRVVRGRKLTGGAVEYDPDRAWTPADLGQAEGQALAILRAHDFPIDHKWPQPGAWAWSSDDLYWAETPTEDGGVLLLEDGSEDQLGMSGVWRGNLGWPDTGRPQDPRAAERWPRFSAFGWALEIVDLLEFQRAAKGGLVERLKQVIPQAAKANPAFPLAELMEWEEEQLAKHERRSRSISGGLDHIFRLGFSLGGYLTEHRIRNAHGDMLGRGEANRNGTAAGAAATNARATAKAEARRKVVLKAAQEALTSGDLPEGYERWSREALVLVLRDTWPEEGKAPSAATLKADLASLERDGKLKLDR